MANKLYKRNWKLWPTIRILGNQARASNNWDTIVYAYTTSL